MPEITSITEETPAQPVSTQVVTAVSEAKSVASTDLPPLYYVIDPEALDELFRPGSREPGSPSGRVEFTFAGCDVVVHADSRVSVTPQQSDTESEFEV